MKTLQMPCVRGACMNGVLGCSWEVLVSRSSKILLSSRPFHDDFAGFSWGSWYEDLGQGLVQILAGRSCSDPGEILSEVVA